MVNAGFKKMAVALASLNPSLNKVLVCRIKRDAVSVW